MNFLDTTIPSRPEAKTTIMRPSLPLLTFTLKRAAVLAAALLIACGSTSSGPSNPHGHHDDHDHDHDHDHDGHAENVAPIPAPESGEPRFVSFPDMVRNELDNGLELNTVNYGALPIVHLRLVVRSGRETDPDGKPGLAQLVGQMLQEGTQSMTSVELAQRIERLGADLSVGTDSDNLYLSIRCLEDQLDDAMAILAEVTTRPSFPQSELDKLKRRESDRLALSRQQPRWLAGRALNRHLYGEGHPYANSDTTAEALASITRRDLQRWHRANVVPNNAFVIAVGAVDPAAVEAAATRAFRRWRPGRVPEVELPAVPERTETEVLLIDRPGSAQSTIYIANLALSRGDEGFVPLEVTNQVLGGSAASRLFLDLREQRSLTYGAYSQVVARVGVGPFVALASVRTAVTDQAVDGLFEHLNRIVTEPVPEEELVLARRALTTNFPLQIETASKVGWLLAELRIHDLPDNYWDSYQTGIVETSAEDALAAAQSFIHPDRALVIVVGDAGAIEGALAQFGPVTVQNLDGETVRELPAQTSETVRELPEQDVAE